jgi:tRNA dimethylallyltransferase
LLIAIMGPTASGKSDVAEHIADRLGLQLVSADAFMVYRGFDIGTNKPKRKDYELVDILDPHEEFGVGEFVRRTNDILWSLSPEFPSPLRGRPGSDMATHVGTRVEGARGEGSNNESPSHPPHPSSFIPHPSPRGAVVVGGTGFYVRALFEEYKGLMPAPDPALRERLEDRERNEGLVALARELTETAPEIAQQTDLQNPVRVRRALEKLADPRPPIEFQLPPMAKHKFVLEPDPHDLDSNIIKRTNAMFAAGWPEEVRELLAQGVRKTAPAFRAIGYQSIVDLIQGRLGEEEAKTRIALETRQYAKRQRTWLRSEPHANVVTAQSATQAIYECLCIPGQ